MEKGQKGKWPVESGSAPYGALTVLVLCAMLEVRFYRAVAPSTERRGMSRGPIEDSYWVRPGRLLAGEYPGSLEDQEARAKLRQLLGADVTLFIDLTEAGEYGLKPYASLLEEEAAGIGRPAVHRRMSVPDMDVPATKQMHEIMAAIHSALTGGETVYVHCFGGIGRTGTVIGCYLVEQGMGAREALAEIARLRQGTKDGWKRSPETRAQRSMVHRWEREGTRRGD